MNSKFYAACGAMAFGLAACSGENGNITGTSTETNPIALLSSSSVENSSSGSFNADDGSLWNPSAGDFSVNVARYAAVLPANAKADGRWFVKTDAEKGGSSSIVWPADFVGVQGERTVVETCNGICGTVSLASYSSEYDPFAGVGFTLAVDDVDKPVPVDVTDWGGVCITYESEAASTLKLDLGDSVNALLGEALPAVALLKTGASGSVTKCFKWNSFALPAWIAAIKNVPESWLKNSGEKAAKQLVALQFVISGAAGEFKFNIKSLGTYADQISDPVSSSSVLTEESSSSSATALSSSSVGVSSSSSTVRSSSSESCVMKTWEQLGSDYPYVRYAEFCESSWPEGAIADGVWRVMELDSSCAYCNKDGVGSGKSSVVWKTGTNENGELLDSTNDRSLQGTVVLDKGTLTVDPFVSIGFTFARDSSGKPVPVDVSDWGGICVEYKVNKDFNYPASMELDLGDSLNAVLGYANPSVIVGGFTKDCFKWEEFKIPSWFKGEDSSWLENTGVKASKHLVGIKFKIQDEPGEYEFRIDDFGSYDRRTFDMFNGPKSI